MHYQSVMLAFPILETAKTVRPTIALAEIGINYFGHPGWREGYAVRDEIGINYFGHPGWRQGYAVRDEIGINYFGHPGWRQGYAVRLNCSVVPSGQCRRVVDRYCYGQ